jgi:hypothetical protein
MKRFIPGNLLEQAAKIQDVLSRIDPKLALGNISLPALIKDIDTLRGIEADLVGMENQMTTLRDQRDVLQKAAWDKVKGARAVIKVIYGDDSLEYELVGGTRRSDRKSSRRTAPPLE